MLQTPSSPNRFLYPFRCFAGPIAPPVSFSSSAAPFLASSFLLRYTSTPQHARHNQYAVAFVSTSIRLRFASCNPNRKRGEENELQQFLRYSFVRRKRFTKWRVFCTTNKAADSLSTRIIGITPFHMSLSSPMYPVQIRRLG